jgi:hypothetical protein
MSGLAGCVMEPRLSLSPNCAAVILAAGDGVRLTLPGVRLEDRRKIRS